MHRYKGWRNFREPVKGKFAELYFRNCLENGWRGSGSRAFGRPLYLLKRMARDLFWATGKRNPSLDPAILDAKSPEERHKLYKSLGLQVRVYPDRPPEIVLGNLLGARDEVCNSDVRSGSRPSTPRR